MKKLLSYLLVIALVLVQFVPVANAAKVSGTNAAPNTTGSIVINNAVIGQKYEIYKLFDLESYSYDNANGNEDGAYTYTILGTSDWYAFVTGEGEGAQYVTVTPYGTEAGKYVVTWNNGANVADFARLALDYAAAEGIDQAKDSIIASSATVEFTDLELGYYLVDSSLGALVSLNTTNTKAEIQEKNTPPTIDKDIMEGATEFDTNNNEDIGDTVNYRVTIAAKPGAQNYVLTDTMDKGLTFNSGSIEVKVGETPLVVDQDYSVVVGGANDNFTFKVEFKKAYLDEIKAPTDIIVTYSATINENAVINGDGNANKAQLKYGDGTNTEESIVRTYVLAFDLFKTDAQNNRLEGAEFELYTEETGGDKINLVIDRDENGNEYYRVATDDETKIDGFTSAIIQVGNARIEGLDEGTYYLEETKAPEGYNRLTNRIAVTLVDTEVTENGITHKTTLSNTSDNTVTYTNNDDDVTIKNFTGSLLPSTGGMGTVMFITVGSIMVLGFGVLLVTKLRISKMEI